MYGKLPNLTQPALVVMLTLLGVAASLLLLQQSKADASRDVSAQAVIDRAPPAMLSPLFNLINDYRGQLQRLAAGETGQLFATAAFQQQLMQLQSSYPQQISSSVVAKLLAGNSQLDKLQGQLQEAVDHWLVLDKQHRFLADKIRQEAWKVEQWSRQLSPEVPQLPQQAARLAIHLGHYLKAPEKTTAERVSKAQLGPLLTGMVDIIEAAKRVDEQGRDQLLAELDAIARQVAASGGFVDLLQERAEADAAVTSQHEALVEVLRGQSRLLLQLLSAEPVAVTVAPVWPIWISAMLALSIATLGYLGFRRASRRDPAVVQLAPEAVSAMPQDGFFDDARHSVKALHTVYSEMVVAIERLSQLGQACRGVVPRLNDLLQSRVSPQSTTQTVEDPVRPCTAATGRIAATLDRQLQQVTEVGESCDRINKAIAEVEDIAFEINLLALNAAVEAAHAQELGNGFAIVATEVRQLAQRSTESASAIRELITESIAQVEDIEQLVRESIAEVKSLAGSIDALKSSDEKPQSIGKVRDDAAVLREEAVQLQRLPEDLDQELLQLDRLAAALDNHSTRLRDLLRARSGQGLARVRLSAENRHEHTHGSRCA